MVCMRWHPIKKIIAVGWRSGEITFYNNQDNTFDEQSSMHKATITSLLWNHTGKRLISTDKDGLLAVWQCNQRGLVQSTPLYHYRLQYQITHSILHASKRQMTHPPVTLYLIPLPHHPPTTHPISNTPPTSPTHHSPYI